MIPIFEKNSSPDTNSIQSGESKSDEKRVRLYEKEKEKEEYRVKVAERETRSQPCRPVLKKYYYIKKMLEDEKICSLIANKIKL